MFSTGPFITIEYQKISKCFNACPSQICFSIVKLVRLFIWVIVAEILVCGVCEGGGGHCGPHLFFNSWGGGGGGRAESTQECNTKES